MLAQLQIGDQHLGQRVEQCPFVGEERPFGRRRALLEVGHLDEPAALARREGRGLLPRRVGASPGSRLRGRRRRCALRSIPDAARRRESAPRAPRAARGRTGDRAAAGAPWRAAAAAPSRASPSSRTSCSRSRSALIRSVTSRLMPTMRTGRPSASRMVCATARIVRMAPSPRRTLKSDLYSRSPRSAASTSLVARARVFRHEAPGPRVERAAELLLANAIEPVHRVVPHEPILLHVPVPDAEPGGFDGELQPVLARAQAGFAFLQLALTPLPRLDFARPDRRTTS